MMNIWETREEYRRKIFTYVRLFSAMIVQQNCLPRDSLWINNPIEEFDFNKMKASRIHYE
ncbi:hypothetical protein Hanom_Chr13g01196131 [Helianthus anomalus]